MVNAGAKNIGVILDNNSRAVSDHLGSGKDWGLERNANGLYFWKQII
jgi:glucose-1-phosphate adenylyltransferase